MLHGAVWTAPYSDGALRTGGGGIREGGGGECLGVGGRTVRIALE